MAFTRKIYQWSGVLSAICLAGIAVVIIAQIIARLAGTQIPSADHFAAWAMASAVFLALPSTFLKGSHIRVTLILTSFGKTAERVMDFLSTLIAIAILAWGTWFIAEYVYESYTYNDVSQGIIAVPLWIPQCTMLIGMVLMLTAFIERLYSLIQGPDILELSSETIIGEE
jgi:TRAP-type C4-dicarboxylate transport system permease small subunit